MVGNAIRSELPAKPDPLALSAYFLSPGAPGPATVAVDVRREGGSVATVAAELRQGDDTRITALATYGDLDRRAGDVRTTASEIDLPPREQCISNRHAPEEIRKFAALMERFEMLFHPDQIGWAVGEPSGRGELSAWFRMVDGREPDPLQLLMVVDALPPVTFDLGPDGLGPDPRAVGARAGQAGPGLVEGPSRHPQRRRRHVRGGLRGLGLLRSSRGAVAPARAAAALRLGRPSAPPLGRQSNQERRMEKTQRRRGCSLTDHSSSVEGQ